jgi:hypothetical protein
MPNVRTNSWLGLNFTSTRPAGECVQYRPCQVVVDAVRSVSAPRTGTANICEGPNTLVTVREGCLQLMIITGRVTVYTNVCGTCSIRTHSTAMLVDESMYLCYVEGWRVDCGGTCASGTRTARRLGYKQFDITRERER